MAADGISLPIASSIGRYNIYSNLAPHSPQNRVPAGLFMPVRGHALKSFTDGIRSPLESVTGAGNSEGTCILALTTVPKKGTIVPTMGTAHIDNLSATLFGKTRRAVLSLLYGHTDESFYIRHILRVVNAGHGAVQRELKQLDDAGIIRRTIQGQQVYYQANDKCPIFNELKNIIRKTFGVADVIRKSLETLTDKIDIAFIFGSVARSTDNKASDIDLIIIGEITFDDAVSTLSKAEDELQREVNPAVYSAAEFRKRVTEKHHFIADVLEGDKIFVIGDEDELRRMAGKRLDKKL